MWPESDNYLSTDRLLLRRLTLDDAEALYALDGDPEVMRFISTQRTPFEHIRDALLPRFIHRYDQFPGFGLWAAHGRESREFLGWFELAVRQPEDLRRPELGYRLRRDFWGRGLATEGSIALIDRAFRELGVDSVMAQAMAVNMSSRRVMEKCGMQCVRTFQLDFDDPVPGTEHGEVEYEISRDQWQQSGALGSGQ